MEIIEEKLSVSTLTQTVNPAPNTRKSPLSPEAPSSMRKLSTNSTDTGPTVSSTSSSRRGSMTTQSDSRRSSFTPESPYMTSDETRARDTLLESDPEPIMEPTTAAPSATAHRGSVVTQMMGRATELISEVAEIIAGVVPPSLSGERLDANTMTADTAVERRAEFFINSPSMEQSISRDFPGKSDNDLEVRRNSLTPESPYNVSDETRSRKENLQDDTAGQQDADVINHGHTIRSGSLSYNYERLD